MTNVSQSPKLFQSQVPHHHHHVLQSQSDIRDYLANLFPHWDSTVQVSQVTGGITNTIYTAKHASSPYQVLIRIFGGKDVFKRDARIRENLIFEQLGNAAISPRLLAVFENGRVESWLYARTISLDEMTSDYVCAGVAKKMACLHGFQPVGVPEKGLLWEVIDAWVGQVVKLAADGTFKGIDVDRCVGCLRIMKDRLLKRESPIVFCHNDLLFGNIMVADNGEVSIVDFEYSSYNYRGFDIGNFFCEAMGGTVDGHVDSTRYPNEAFRTRFCRTYLEESGVDATEERVTSLVQEAEDYGLVSHMYWGFWALAQHASSTVDFPYLMFAENRFTEFFKRFTDK